MPTYRLCDCKHTGECHIPRQNIQSLIRENDPEVKVTDCIFYRMQEGTVPKFFSTKSEE